jgi:hypothetical protein
MCKNKLFNKFLFISFIFFTLSIVVNAVFIISAVSIPTKQAKAQQTTEQIHVQQRIILNKLERVEKKMKRKKMRRQGKNVSPN